MSEPALAGHASEVIPPELMPHEMVGAIVIIAFILVILCIVCALAWRPLRRFFAGPADRMNLFGSSSTDS